jgi:copper resistance protein C
MNKPRIPASRPVSALLLLALLLAFSAGVASAHETTVVQSEPADGATVAASPSQVTAKFSEELDTQGSTMVVLDGSGRQVSDGPGKVDLDDPDHATMIATLPSPLVDGKYTVNWHAVLTDGDASDGSFTFTVQAAGDPATPMPTASPTAAPTNAATVSPTVTPAIVPSDAPTAAPASADTTGAAPGQLPVTGSNAHRTTAWPAVAIGGLLTALGTGLVLLRSRR